MFQEFLTPASHASTSFAKFASVFILPRVSRVMWKGRGVLILLSLVRTLPGLAHLSAVCMGRAIALCGRSGRIVSFLSAVPCLSGCTPQPAAERRMSDQGKSSVSTLAGAPAPGSDTYKGWLFKWTNYLKGYQRRWFVLSNGLLSYYR